MASIGASFTDSVIAALAKSACVFDSIVAEPTWDEDRRVLLVRIEPKSKENAQEVADDAVELIRQIRGFDFKAEVQQLDVDGKGNYFFKLHLKKNS